MGRGLRLSVSPGGAVGRRRLVLVLRQPAQIISPLGVVQGEIPGLPGSPVGGRGVLLSVFVIVVHLDLLVGRLLRRAIVAGVFLDHLVLQWQLVNIGLALLVEILDGLLAVELPLLGGPALVGLVDAATLEPLVRPLLPRLVALVHG